MKEYVIIIDLEGVGKVSLREEALHMHRENKGKLESKSKVKVENAKGFKFGILPRGCRAL